MSFSTKSINLEYFVKHKVRDRDSMLKASRRIDEFRKKYGKVDKNFNSTDIIRKMRDSRR